MDNKHRLFTVSPYPLRPSSPWKLEIKASVAGRKIRRFCQTEATAYVLADELLSQIKTEGTRSIENPGGLTVERGVKQYLAFRGAKLQPRHKTTTERILGEFVATYGNRAIESLSPLELESYWDDDRWPDGGAGRYQVYSYLRIWFNWLERKDLIEKNIIRRVDAPTKPTPRKGVLTADEMRTLLTAAKNTPYLQAWLALGGFAGLRSVEVIHTTPKDLNWTGKEIHVGQHKTGERYVRMQPAFIRNCPKQWEFPNQRNLYLALRKLKARCGIKIPDNALRHSFGTYYAALTKNTAETANQMGNSEKMVKSVYAKARPGAEVKKWWKL